jgi:polyphosphate kinase
MDRSEQAAHDRLKKAVLSGESSHPKQLARGEYKDTLRALQIELLKLQRWVKAEGARVCVLFEGRDAAGKGGAIQRVTKNLNPRGARIVALGKPSDVERSQWYFQRYVKELPSGGEIVLFDRSWYNRAVVERVMEFCTPAEYDGFMGQVPAFERMLIEDGIHLIKLWFSLGQEEQANRLAARRKDPLKRWKISPVDEAALDRFGDFTEAIADMFLFTDTDDSPWTLINGNEKRRARLAAIGTVLERVPYEPRDESVVDVDAAVAAPASRLFTEEDQLVRR